MTPDAGEQLEQLELRDTWSLPSLTAPVEVVYTELDVPHVYAADMQDAVRVQGFLYARDRLFTMELARRLALGEVSGLLGSLGLSIDVDSRLTGMTHVTDQLLEATTSEQRERLAAYAEGINAAIAAMRDGRLPLPSELSLAAPLLGTDDPAGLLTEFEVRDVAAVLATLVYQLAFSKEDVDHELAISAALASAEGTWNEDARARGVVQDLYGAVRPLSERTGAPTWTPSSQEARGAAGEHHVPRGIEDLLRDVQRRLDRRDVLIGVTGRDRRGSNAWAVDAEHAGGRTLLAGDGHLPLSVPALFWQIGIDTSVLGDGSETLLGLGLPGLPGIAVGTNGQVAWSQTRLRGDVVDWYSEVLQLDPDSNAVTHTEFQGAWEPVVSRDEVIEVAAGLGSEAETLRWQRLETFDGRFLVSVEGTPVEGEPQTGDVRLADGWIRPGDEDGDGVVRGISFDYTALDPSGVLSALQGFSEADNMAEFSQATRFLNGYGQNILAADRHGDVLYSSFQAMPCRETLDRSDGFGPGSDPGRVLDGRVHPGFVVPITETFEVDDDNATHCLVPYDDHPGELTPPRGWVMSANQDPGGWSLDDDLSNGRWYMGGPWDAGYRAERIGELLEQVVADKAADIEDMRSIQDDHEAGDARVVLPRLLQLLDEAVQEDGTAAAEAYGADAARLAEARERLEGWLERGLVAASGVETFYHAVDEGEIDDATATMIYYAWQAAFVDRVFGDEGLDAAIWRPYAESGVIRSMVRLLDGRGADNPLGLASWLAETEESVFFDDASTEETEAATTLAVQSLSEALDRLTGPSTAPGQGGFGTDDMDAWRWGLRHTVRFESILASALGDDPLLSTLTRQFAITTDVLPLGEDVGPGDPRQDLLHFPRPGASGSVDQAGHGFDLEDYSYTNGPAFRMVFSLGPEGVEGVNILPGGQSALTDSPHFADQAALWLGNDTIPMRYTLDEVVAGSGARDRFVP